MSQIGEGGPLAPDKHNKSVRESAMKRLMSGLFVLAGLTAAALAQDIGTGPITVVVPYAAGGAMDSVGRIAADRLQGKLGVPSVVDNRVGGNGVVGMTYVSRAAPDGRTLMISSETGQAVLPAIDPAFPIDTLNTFTPVSLVGTFPHFLVVRKSLGVNTVAEFVAAAKASPGKFNFGHGGIGTIAHMSMELLQKKSGTQVQQVPYRGLTPALVDLLGDRVDGSMLSLPVLLPQLQNPALKVLAVLSPERDKRFPDVPTMVESGFPDVVFVSWTAVFGPPKMPAGVVARLSTALSEGINTPETVTRLRDVGFQAVGSDAATLDAFQRQVAANWKKIAQDTGFKMPQ
jgi:tripartite-type tricarboxylate transporter receptor subunit TctC